MGWTHVSEGVSLNLGRGGRAEDEQEEKEASILELDSSVQWSRLSMGMIGDRDEETLLVE